MGSSVLEHAIKVRKPYTITKQRERWTEEEHNKFVEALKLYGRAWHRIEVHIGSKTAVQIRSHAQKFFTKAVRESKTIEIPPPRPKKKPMHPYPRKLGNSSSVPVTEKFPAPEHDNPSPMSVLSSASDQMNGCTSPVSSAVGSDPVGTSPCEQENGCHSTTTSVDDEDESLLQHTSDMEFDLGSDDGVRGKEASSMQASPASLKLFGRTVVVANPQNPSSSNVEDSEPAVTIDISRQFPARGYEESAIDGVSWSSWPNNMAPMFYILPSHGNLANFAEAGIAPMPWIWAFSGENQSLARECTDDGSVEKESSSADFNNVELSIKDTSTRVFGDRALNDHGEMPVKFTWSETSAFRSLKATPKKDAKGFVPYKRCIATREVDDQKMINDDGEELRVLQLSL